MFVELFNANGWWVVWQTSVAMGMDLEDKMPYNEYYEYFGLDYTLHVTPNHMKNQNSCAYIDSNIRGASWNAFQFQYCFALHGFYIILIGPWFQLTFVESYGDVAKWTKWDWRIHKSHLGNEVFKWVYNSLNFVLQGKASTKPFNVVTRAKCSFFWMAYWHWGM